MANRFRTRLSKLVLSTKNNLVSLNKPFRSMAGLLKNKTVTGIIDAGASSGNISKRLLANFPQATVYAFEPNPLYHETLTRYAARETRFKPQFAALSDKNGRSTLFMTESPGSTSLLVPMKNTDIKIEAGSTVLQKTDIDVVSIDSWAEKNNIKDIHVMKFDIQGNELAAFRGASKTLTDSTLLVYTEIMFTPMYQDGAIYSQLDLCLRDFGFELYDIFSPKYLSNGRLGYANAVFIKSEYLKYRFSD